MITAFSILAAVFFCLPFMIWMFIRWLERAQREVKPYYKTIIWSSFAACIPLFIMFILLAVFL